MKKIYLLFSILIAITTETFSQEITGTWYGINRTGLIEFKLTSDSLKMKTLYSDLRAKGFESDNKRHAGIFKLEDKFLIVFTDKAHNNNYKAMTLFNFRDGESIEIAANGINSVSETIDELIKLSGEDTTTLYGNIIYSQKFIPALQKMKDIEQMTLQDFKIFLRNFIQKRNVFKDVNDNMAGTLTYQLITRTLYEMGYNPINGIDVVERYFEKFIDDPEVKELLKQI